MRYFRVKFSGNWLLAFFISFLILTGCDSGHEQKSSVDDATAQQLISLIEERASEYNIPGVVIAVKKSGMSTWIGTTGVSDLSTNTAITGSDKFRIGSNTKTFAAMTILQLAQEGTLLLDDSLEKWLPNTLLNYDTQNITIRQLLNHTSGVYNFTEDSGWGNDLFYNSLKTWTPQDLINIAVNNSDSKYCSPGECFHYSNTNYILLGRIIEKATGSTYEEEVKKRFIEPLGLANTSVPLTGETSMTGNYSHGYYNEAGVDYDYTKLDPSFTWSSGNIISSADDMTKWIMAVGRGELLDNKYQDEMLQYTDMGFDNLQYGLGIVNDPDHGMFGHQGGIIGYSTEMFYVEGEDTAIAVLMNTSLSLHNFGDAILYDALAILFPSKSEKYKAIRKTRGTLARPQAVGTLCEYCPN